MGTGAFRHTWGLLFNLACCRYGALQLAARLQVKLTSGFRAWSIGCRVGV